MINKEFLKSMQGIQIKIDSIYGNNCNCFSDLGITEDKNQKDFFRFKQENEYDNYCISIKSNNYYYKFIDINKRIITLKELDLLYLDLVPDYNDINGIITNINRKNSDKKIYLIDKGEYMLRDIDDDYLNMMIKVGLVFKDKRSRNKRYNLLTKKINKGVI